MRLARIYPWTRTHRSNAPFNQQDASKRNLFSVAAPPIRADLIYDRDRRSAAAGHQKMRKRLTGARFSLSRKIWRGGVLHRRRTGYLSTRYGLVTGRKPRGLPRFCAFCCEPIDSDYLREFGTRIIYCGTECFEIHVAAAANLLITYRGEHATA
jgi:hypothetical protein